MEINLSKYNATSLEINGTLPISKPILSALKQCYPKQKIVKTNDFVEFGSDYVVKKEKCSARALVEKINAKECQVYFYYTDHILAKLSGDSKLLPVDDMLKCLTALPNKMTFEVTANFRYAGGKFKSRMLLPIKLAQDDFDEVRGVRLVKLADGKNLYTLTIDRPSNKSIFHTVYFSYAGNVSEDLPQLILDEAVSISKRGLE